MLYRKRQNNLWFTIRNERTVGSGMIHIAICDDEKEFVEYLRGLLERYADETGGWAPRRRADPPDG